MHQLTWPHLECEIPEDVERVIQRADELVDQANQRLVVENPAFVPTNYRALYRHLRSIQETHGRGPRFCEWGSGLGVATIMADLLGFDAIGIEIDPELANQSLELAQLVGSQAELLHGSFVPARGGELVDELDDLFWLHTESDDTYQRLGLTVSDMQLIYVYPWPGEVRFVCDLFQAYAEVGALLMVYHGADEWDLWQK